MHVEWIILLFSKKWKKNWEENSLDSNAEIFFFAPKWEARNAYKTQELQKHFLDMDVLLNAHGCFWFPITLKDSKELHILNI